MKTQQYFFRRNHKASIAEMDNKLNAVIEGINDAKEVVEKYGSNLSFHFTRVRKLFIVDYTVTISGDTHLVEALESDLDNWV